RATRVAAVDRGVGLDVVVERARLDVAAARRHDAGRHGAAKAERVADRHHRLADLDLGQVAELDVGSSLSVLTLSTARSVFSSPPNSLAGSLRPSDRVTVIESALPATW